MSQSLFGFPIIPDDLRCEENILQASRNLRYLNKIFESTVESITSTIDANARKISEINDRLSLIDYKINKIKGSNKAIQIYSGSKYPRVKNTDNSNRTRTILKEKLNAINTNEQLGNNKNTSYVNVDDSTLKNRQQFYRVNNVFDHVLNLDVATQGLGNLLADPVKSVSSLLLFNTAQHL
jgi:WAS family protein 1